ncbi:GGDEF domain-containing protein [Thalassotalea sp. LPB0316]|uniref:GGDEF domain-containing protein n=1 Tax=Thalassotalea sp. LPB0316 TaxID=2769490 RepID=UPI0018686B2F|nr:GGDEF domain-containing protein [Thalassotalea sp. LPB0316]QOL25152.1 GGDEF domain-containing protein [Thalassotalea sp. LPB0316]
MTKFIGVKTSLVSICFLLMSLVVVSQVPFVAQWVNDISVNQLALLMLISFLFASQFNHSRFALLIALFALVLVLELKLVNLTEHWVITPEIVNLSVIFFFGGLAFLKDRSLFSIHLVSRIALFVVAYLFAQAWLLGVDTLMEIAKDNTYFQVVKPYLSIELPLMSVILIYLVKSLKTTHLFYPAALASVVLWYLTQANINVISWQLSLTLLVCYYLISVIASSYFLAYRDELTGLPSRRALNQLALSLGRKYSVAMMDVDHFKKFNDTYGHDIGDQVLKLVAAKLKQVKAGGKVFRYGGEEFTVVFPRKNAEQVFDELDNLRQSIADYQMVIRQGVRKTKKDRDPKNKPTMQEKMVSVTISIGVAQRSSGQSFEQVLKSADELLYKAKKRGRNNVTK